MPVITLDYAHFRGYLKDGCNAVLINASTMLPENALPSERVAHASAAYTRAIRHAMDRREKLFHCSANFAAQFTVERVAKEVNRTLAHVPPWNASTSFCIFRPTLLRLSGHLEDLVKDLHELVQAAAVAVTHMKVVAVAAVGLHVAVFCVFATLVVAAVVSWQLRRARRNQRFCGVPVRLRQDDAQQAHTVPNGECARFLQSVPVEARA